MNKEKREKREPGNQFRLSFFFIRTSRAFSSEAASLVLLSLEPRAWWSCAS